MNQNLRNQNGSMLVFAVLLTSVAAVALFSVAGFLMNILNSGRNYSVANENLRISEQLGGIIGRAYEVQQQYNQLSPSQTRSPRECPTGMMAYPAADPLFCFQADASSRCVVSEITGQNICMDLPAGSALVSLNMIRFKTESTPIYFEDTFISRAHASLWQSTPGVDTESKEGSDSPSVTTQEENVFVTEQISPGVSDDTPVGSPGAANDLGDDTETPPPLDCNISKTCPTSPPVVVTNPPVTTCKEGDKTCEVVEPCDPANKACSPTGGPVAILPSNSYTTPTCPGSDLCYSCNAAGTAPGVVGAKHGLCYQLQFCPPGKTCTSNIDYYTQNIVLMQ